MRLRSLVIVACSIALSACLPPDQPTTEPVDPDTADPVEDEPAPADPCEMDRHVQKLQYATVKDGKVIERGEYDQNMPVMKPIAHESHYLVEGHDPKAVSKTNELVIPHIARTCSKLLRGDWKKYYPGLTAGCLDVYKGTSANSWTPAEGGGNVGRGTGVRYPSIECEAATGNQYWAKGHAPKPGTKYILKNPDNGRAFVLCFGYESGPGSKEFSGGASTESLYYTRLKHRSLALLGRAKDQSLPYGPLECRQ